MQVHKDMKLKDHQHIYLISMKRKLYIYIYVYMYRHIRYLCRFYQHHAPIIIIMNLSQSFSVLKLNNGTCLQNTNLKRQREGKKYFTHFLNHEIELKPFFYFFLDKSRYPSWFLTLHIICIHVCVCIYTHTHTHTHSITRNIKSGSKQNTAQQIL